MAQRVHFAHVYVLLGDHFADWRWGAIDQVRMSRTPGAYDPVLVSRGSSPPAWLPR